MKKIGIVDYYISEWHANNYIPWIRDICEKTGFDYQIKYYYSEREDSPFDGRSADKWGEDYKTKRCKTIKSLCSHSDCIMILAPSDPETHLRLAKQVFKYCAGKPVYIDKTFAPDLKTAEKIYDLADKAGVKFFSSSALRYATEIDEFSNQKSVMITFGGGNFPEYLVHPLEIAIKMLGTGVNKVKVEKISERQTIARGTYSNGKSFTLIYSPSFGFTIDALEADGSSVMQKQVVSATFTGLLTDVLNFYETGKISFDRSQTLEIMRVREALIKAQAKDNKWINI